MSREQIEKTEKNNAKKATAVKKVVKATANKKEEKAICTGKAVDEKVEEKVDEKNTVEEAVTEIEKEKVMETVNTVTSNRIWGDDEHNLKVLIQRNGSNGTFEDIKFVLSENGKTYLGVDKLINIPVETVIGNAAKFDCLNELKSYDYSITDSDLKEAFDKLQDIIRQKKFIMETDEMTVEEVLDAVFEHAEFMVSESKKMSSEERKKFQNRYRVDKDSIMIGTKIMDEVLQEIGAEGYTKTIMCKRIALLENFLGVKILIRNRSGKKGYDFNTTGNIAFYKFDRNWRSGNVQK